MLSSVAHMPSEQRLVPAETLTAGACTCCNRWTPTFKPSCPPHAKAWTPQPPHNPAQAVQLQPLLARGQWAGLGQVRRSRVTDSSRACARLATSLTSQTRSFRRWVGQLPGVLQHSLGCPCTAHFLPFLHMLLTDV